MTDSLSHTVRVPSLTKGCRCAIGVLWDRMVVDLPGACVALNQARLAA
jgi:hypothetical protein